MSEGYDQSTDTHLAKKYNDIIYDCIMRCNVSGLMLESQKHYDNLKMYYASIDNLYVNTFFLFTQINIKYTKDGSVHEAKLFDRVMKLRQEIKDKMNRMKQSMEYQTEQYFDEVIEICSTLRMWIMYGLQKLKMLVRTSVREPRGQESIQHWDKKAIFKKGGIKFEKP